MKIAFYLCSVFLYFLSSEKGEALPKVSFELSMSVLPGYQPEQPEWKFAKSLYENYQNEASLCDEYIIPKRIHLIWLGSPLPEKCKAMVASWKKFHPDWIVKVWTDEDAASFQFINQEAFHQAQNYGEKSDIWRYEILYRYGGMYVDTDFECLQPFDELHRSCEFYTGLAQTPNPVILIGLIGSRAGHPILKAAIDHLQIGSGDHDVDRIMDHTGPYHFSRVFFALAPICEKTTVVAFPVTFFYPFPGSERRRTDQINIKREFVKPESMAIHYFATSWQK